MRSRLILNLVLFLAAIALGLLYLRQPDEPAATPEAISDINADAVISIRIERPDSETIELAKTDGDWRLVAPLATDAEDGRVGSILLLPLSGSQSRFSATDERLDKFGLEPAQLTLYFDEEKFVVGDVNPLDEEQRYVLYNDEIHLIDGRLYQRLNAPLTYYVNPALTPPDSELTRIRLPHGVISRREDGWRVIPTRMSDRPDNIAQQWQSTRATYIKRRDESVAEFTPRVELEFAEHEPLTYYIIDTEPQIILARDDLGLQYHLRSNLTDKLLLVEPPEKTNP